MIDTPVTNLLRTIFHKKMVKQEHELKFLSVSPQQGRTLAYLDEHQNEGLIQKDLAEALDRRGASITNHLQGLEKAGFIERRIDKTNERQKRIFLLDKGQQIVSQIEQYFLDAEQDMLAPLNDEEIATLINLLTKIERNL